MPTNDFLPVAGGAGANVKTQAAYLALLSTVLANGFSSGVVDSPTFNKALRQASAIAAGVAQYVADLSGDNVLDDGNSANLLASIKKAIAAQIDAQSGNYALDTGGANASVIAVSPPVTVYPPGMTVRFRKAVSNTAACTLDAGAGPLPLNNDLNGALLANDAPAGSVIVASFDAAANTWLINTLVPSQAMSQTAADARYLAIAAGLKFGGIAPIVNTTVHTVASIGGKFVSVNSAAATTQTFPLASTVAPGQAVGFTNLGAGLITFARQGADNLLGGLSGSTSFVLNTGESFIAVCDGGANWHILFANGAVGLAPQTWQNVTASRSAGTSFTNNTGREIKVIITCTLGPGAVISGTVAGVTVGTMSNSTGASMTMSFGWSVPNGALYSNAGVTAASSWFELR